MLTHTTTKGITMKLKILGTVLLATVSLSMLTACTEGDKRIIHDFTGPKAGASQDVVDPSIMYQREQEKKRAAQEKKHPKPVASPTPTYTEPVTHTYTVKLWGALTNQVLLYVDGTPVNVGTPTIPLVMPVQTKEQRVAIIGQTIAVHHARGGCTIRDENGTIVLKKVINAKSRLVACIYDADAAK